MAPSFVLDYVIIHELCHLKYLNHSKIIGKWLHYMPDYKKARNWLKQYGMQWDFEK